MSSQNCCYPCLIAVSKLPLEKRTVLGLRSGRCFQAMKATKLVFPRTNRYFRLTSVKAARSPALACAACHSDFHFGRAENRDP